MAPGSPLSPTDVEMRQLTAEEAVVVLRELLVAEAIRLGIALSRVNVPFAMTVRDGGIDASVDASAIGDVNLSGELVQNGLTCYQCKTGAFSAAKPAEIKRLLFKPASLQSRAKSLGSSDLQEQVLACLRAGGTLVFALFGSDAIDRTPNYTEGKIREQIAAALPEFANAKLMILRSNQIASLCARHAAISLRVKRLSILAGVVETMAAMHEQSGFAPGPLQPDARRTSQINQVREALRDGNSFLHVRLIGDPGTGKTRLAYEIASDSQIEPISLYCRNASFLVDAPQALNALQQVAKASPVLLIVDECGSQERLLLTEFFSRTSLRCVLLTLYTERPQADIPQPNEHLLDVEALRDESIQGILETYGIAERERGTVAALCEGSPRVAHAVGECLRANLTLHAVIGLRRLDDIWVAFVAGRDGSSASDLNRRLHVLRCIALFRRFGWKDEFRGEAQTIWELIVAPLDPSIGWNDFCDIIEYLLRRRVLQGWKTLYITPRLLHIKLWCDWWDRNGQALDVLGLMPNLSPGLVRWLTEMFAYARESHAATQAVDLLLSETGPYSKHGAFADEAKGQLFFTVAQINPRAAVRRAEDALASMSLEERREFRQGRRPLIHALERLAMYGEAFLSAAKCLLLLAEAENESWSNNASGVFCDLFTLGYGQMASSSLSPAERLPVLLEALRSESLSRRALALEAFSRALRTQFTKTHLGDVAGLRALPAGWTPATYGDIHKEYHRYLIALLDELTDLEQSEARRAGTFLAHQLRELVHVPGLAAILLPRLAQLSTLDQQVRTALLEALIAVRHYDKKGLPSDTTEIIDDEYRKIAEESFEGRLRRVATFDSVEDKINETGEFEDQLASRLEAVVVEVVAHPELLDAHLNWLGTADAKNAYQFGMAMGNADSQQRIWRRTLQAWRIGGEESVFLPAGYLAGVFGRDQNERDRLLFEIAEDPDTRGAYPALMWRSGITAASLQRLFILIESGDVPAESLRFFSYGGAAKGFAREDLARALKILLGTPTSQAAISAVELVHGYLYHVKDDAHDLMPLVFEVLTNSQLFDIEEGDRRTQMIEYQWNALALKLEKVRPDISLELGERCIRALANRVPLLAGFHSQTHSYLDAVSRREPKRIWTCIGEELERGTLTSTHRLLQWLRADLRNLDSDSAKPKGGFACFPVQVVCDWVAPDPGKRGPVIAQFAPVVIDPYDNFETSLAHELLVRFGEHRGVRSALHASYWTESYWGPASGHYATKREAITAGLAHEKNGSVRSWLQTELDGLSLAIERERGIEERDRFG